MGGPWRDRGFDPRAWRPPMSRVAVQTHRHGMDSLEGGTRRIVIGYVAAVLASCVILLCLLEFGW